LGSTINERIIEEARKYRTKREFEEKDSFLYHLAHKRKVMDRCTWFVSPARKWTQETCFAEAQKYHLLYDFRHQSASAYVIARRNGWLKEYTWLQELPKTAWNKKWNHETCFAEAQKYKTKGEFGKKAGGAYDVARKNGWLAEYTWFPDFTDSDAQVDSVYCYKFEEFHSIYVGRTLMYRQHLRDVEHHIMAEDTVLRFASMNNCPIPKMDILEENLTVEQGRIREDFWRRHYEAQEWNVLNIGATGAGKGSTGNLGFGKWDFETVYNIALNFESASQLNKAYPYLYSLSRNKGWIKDFYWFRGMEIRSEKRTTYTEEYCRTEAHKYKTRTEFRKANRGVYEKAKKAGWLVQYDWLDYNVGKDWTYEACYAEAQKYTTIGDFMEGSYGAYDKSKQNGWFKDYTWLKKRPKSNIKWTREAVFELAKECHSVTELRRRSSAAENKARKNGWLKEFTWFTLDQKPPKYWNKERCEFEARKYKTLKEFRKNCCGAFARAKANGWLEDYSWLTKKTFWTDDSCKIEASKYKNRSEFKKGAPGAFEYAKKKNLLSTLFSKEP